MINEDTPYKLAEIIRDTWPQLYYLKRDDNAIINDMKQRYYKLYYQTVKQQKKE